MYSECAALICLETVITEYSVPLKYLNTVHQDLGLHTVYLTFPDGPYIPSKIDQSFLFRFIPLHIPLKLGLPISDIRFRHRGFTIWTPVPEAPMDEYRNFPPGKAYVGTAYVPSLRVIYPPMNPVSRETRISKHASYC